MRVTIFWGSGGGRVLKLRPYERYANTFPLKYSPPLSGYRVLICSPGYPGIHYVDQSGPKLRSACISFPTAGIKSVHHHKQFKQTPGAGDVEHRWSTSLEGMRFYVQSPVL